MAKDEKLNEEAGPAPYIQPTLGTKEKVLLNQLSDREKQLPKKHKSKDGKRDEDDG